MPVDFDQLATSYRQTDGSRASLDQLWGAVFDLTDWFFITRGEMPNMAPYCAVIEGRPMVHAFTDDDRCDAYARHLGFEDENGCTPIMIMSPDAFFGWIEILEANDVWGIIFNQGPYNFYAPLANLQPIHEHLCNRRLAG